MKNFQIFCILISIATIMSACGKEGPVGPAGEPGPQGPGSVKGQTFTVSNWVFNDPSWIGTIDYPAITQAIVNTGGVFVYWKNDAGNWTALPLTFYATDWYATTLEAEHRVGGVKILKTDSDLTQPVVPGDQTFKVVVMDSEGLARNPDLNWDNFEVVSERFHWLESE